MHPDQLIHRLALEADLPGLHLDEQGQCAVQAHGLVVGFYSGTTPDLLFTRTRMGRIDPGHDDTLEMLLAANRSPELVCGSGLGLDDDGNVYLTQHFSGESVEFSHFSDSVARFITTAQAWQSWLVDLKTPASLQTPAWPTADPGADHAV